jgi:small GTP-binding protein
MSARPSDAESIRSDLKIIVIGSSGTGKTSYVNKWTKNIFQEEYKATIVSEFGFKVFEHEGKLYRIQLWDLAGQDKNSTVTKIFAKDSHGCIILSDATKPNSLEE